MYHSKNISEIIKNLLTDEQIGLLEKEVLKRIDKHGKNIIPKKKRKSIFKIFLEELLSPIELILLITIVISIIIKENTDAIRLYEKLGFHFINKYDTDGELIYVYDK